MKNVIEATFQIVRLNFGGEILKDMKRMIRNLNRISGWVLSIQDRREILWASRNMSGPGGNSGQTPGIRNWDRGDNPVSEWLGHKAGTLNTGYLGNLDCFYLFIY